MDEDRIEKAISKGEDAFWAAVTTQFPEATTGDLSPDMVFTLRRTMERAIREWVDANVGADLSLAD